MSILVVPTTSPRFDIFAYFILPSNLRVRSHCSFSSLSLMTNEFGHIIILLVPI